VWKLLDRFKTSQVRRICRSLSELGISFEGPLRTPRGNVIFLIDGRILLESELLSLLKDGQFTKKAVVALSEYTWR
jgi:hypothetical protein